MFSNTGAPFKEDHKIKNQPHKLGIKENSDKNLELHVKKKYCIAALRVHFFTFTKFGGVSLGVLQRVALGLNSNLE